MSNQYLSVGQKIICNNATKAVESAVGAFNANPDTLQDAKNLLAELIALERQLESHIRKVNLAINGSKE